MPTKDHVFKTPTGKKLTVRLQGLPYMLKEEVDTLTRQEAEEDRMNGTSRPSLWAARIVARAVRTPKGKVKYVEMHEWLSAAVALAEQLQAAELVRASNVVLTLSGYGAEAEEQAGK